MKLKRRPDLDGILAAAVNDAVQEFASVNLHSSEIASTLVLLEGECANLGSHRGEDRIYPASVIKLFYLEAAHAWMEARKMEDSPELRRALHDMIVHSSNDATHYVVDLLTGTTGGPELPESEMAVWAGKRQTVNRYFAGRGFDGVNICQKPWNEGPYGRERAYLGPDRENRNLLTTEASARLLCEMALGRCVSAERSRAMLQLLERNPRRPSTGADDQATGFIGRAVPLGARIWSKAGWTSEVRHDAACIELQSGVKVVLVIFTEGRSSELQLIPAFARMVLERIPGQAGLSA